MKKTKSNRTMKKTKIMKRLQKLKKTVKKRGGNNDKKSKTLYFGLVQIDNGKNPQFVIQDESKEGYLNSKRWVCNCIKTNDKKKLLSCGCVLRDDDKVNMDISWSPDTLILNQKCYSNKKGGSVSDNTSNTLKEELIQEGDIVGYENNGQIERAKVIKIHNDVEGKFYDIEISNSTIKQTVLDRLLLANIELDMKPSKSGKDVNFIFRDNNELKQFYDCDCDENPDIIKKKENPRFLSKLFGRTTKKDINLTPLKCECNSKIYNKSFNDGFDTEEREECYDI